VCESSALVVGGEDEYLGLAREPSKSARVENAIPITLKTGAIVVGLLWLRSISATMGESSGVTERRRLLGFGAEAISKAGAYQPWILMSGDDAVWGAIPVHGCDPLRLMITMQVNSLHLPLLV
jgi:hypothetical protein